MIVSKYNTRGDYELIRESIALNYPADSELVKELVLRFDDLLLAYEELEHRHYTLPRTTQTIGA